MHKRFQNKSIIVTGAGGGIGLASAQAFAKEGGQVLLSDLKADSIKAEAKKIRDAGGIAEYFVADVTDSEQCKAMVNYAVEKFGSLHIAFNNAGIPSDITSSFSEGSIETWDRVTKTNMSSLYYCMLPEVVAIKKSGGGAIVNTASVCGKMGAPGMPAYVSSKHGVVGLSKAAAIELIRENIRVNAVCPGSVVTPMTAGLEKTEEGRAMLNGSPIGRPAQASEIAAAVLFLASDDASYIVGAALNVDGGVLI